MRKLVESTFIGLDGTMSAPQKWGAVYWDDDHTAYASALMRPAESLLLGRRTYDGFAASWPLRSGDWYTDKINAMPKHAVSRGTPELDWNARLLEGGLVEGVRALKAADGG